MRKLPLACDTAAAITKEWRAPHNPECNRCKHRARKKELRCQKWVGEPGGIYVITDYASLTPKKPGKIEAAFMRDVRTMARQTPVAFDWALRCPLGRGKIKKGAVDACRTYTGQSIREVNPTLIIIGGRRAMESVLGRAEDPYSVHGASGWIDEYPYVVIDNPFAAYRNHFRKERLTATLQEVLGQWKPAAPFDPYSTYTNVIETVADVQQFCRRAEEAKWLCYDLETYGQWGDKDFRILSVAVSFDVGLDSYTWGPEECQDWDLIEPLFNILSTKPLSGQNIKYDLVSLFLWMKAEAYGKKYLDFTTYHDTKIVNRLLDTECSSELETMGELIGCGGHKKEAKAAIDEAADVLRKEAKRLRARAKKGKGLTDEEQKLCDIVSAKRVKAYCFAEIPADKLMRYNALDTIITAELVRRQRRRLEQEEGLFFIWDDVIADAITAFSQIEVWGVPVCQATLDLSIAKLEEEVAEAEATCRSIVGNPEFNPGSNPQVGRFLFGHKQLVQPDRMAVFLGLLDEEDAKTEWIPGICGMPPELTPSGQVKVDDIILGKIRHPLASAVLAFRKVKKQLGTYGYGIKKFVRDDGRIHASFNLDGARSGRLSSSDPNMQNQTKFSKRYYKAGPGRVLIELDYSQQEFRVAGDISGDEKMIELFRAGVDFHMGVARTISKVAWGIEPDDVTSDHRRQAKAFGFGLLYGMTDSTLVKSLGITIAAAARIRAAILGEFKGLARCIRAFQKGARQEGRAPTFWKGCPARSRNLMAIRSQNPGEVINATNSAFNSPVQGTANEYNTASASALVRWIQANDIDCKVIATVHDAIWLDCVAGVVDLVVGKTIEIMESWPMMNNTPLVADIKIGKRLSDLEDAEFIDGTVKVAA